MQINLRVLRKMEQNQHNTHWSLYLRKKLNTSYFLLQTFLMFAICRDSQSETDCIMFDSSKMSPEKVCLDLRFSYLGFNFQLYLQESASSNFLIENAWLEICPSAIIWLQINYQLNQEIHILRLQKIIRHPRFSCSFQKSRCQQPHQQPRPPVPSSLTAPVPRRLSDSRNCYHSNQKIHGNDTTNPQQAACVQFLLWAELLLTRLLVLSGYALFDGLCYAKTSSSGEWAKQGFQCRRSYKSFISISAFPIFISFNSILLIKLIIKVLV